MAEYIKKETALKLLCKDIDSDVRKYAYAAQMAASTIASFPKEDVVDIVRCKDCVYNDRPEATIAVCTIAAASRTPKDFCSRGRKRQ